MKGTTLTSLEKWVMENEMIMSDTHYLSLLGNLAQLLLSKPKLGDFIPCDKEGNVLEKPVKWDELIESGKWTPLDIERCKAYQEAEQRVLWKGDWKVPDGYKDMVTSSDGKIVYLNRDLTYADLKNKGLVFKREL